MFSIFKKGFSLTFENGLCISTRFGGGNYCDNYESDFNSKDIPPCKDCEIAILDTLRGDAFVTKEFFGKDNDVKGYVTFNEWLEIVDKIKNWKRGEKMYAVTYTRKVLYESELEASLFLANQLSVLEGMLEYEIKEIQPYANHEKEIK